MRWIVRRKVAWVAAAVVAAVGGLVAQARSTATVSPALHDLQIVWSRRVYLHGKQRSYMQLWRMRGDGTGARQIISGKYDYSLVEICRSRRLRYFRDDYLWESDFNGKHARKVRRGVPEDWYVPEIKMPDTLTSPDGRWQYRISKTDYDQASEVATLIDRKTGTIKRFSDDVSSLAAWSPRSDVLVIFYWDVPVGDLEDLTGILMLLDPFEGKKERVQCPKKLIDEGVVTWPLLWSSDGRFICVSIPMGHDLHSLWVYDRSTRKWKHIQSAEDASWSPAGDFLLYKSTRDLAPFDGMQLWVSHIFIYDAMTGATRQLTSGTTFNESPMWLPIEKRKTR